MVQRLLFIVNVDWFFLSHRLPIALAARDEGYEIHIATALTKCREEMLAHGFVVHPLEIDRGGVGLASSWNSLFGILRVMRNVRPDLVHLVTIKPVLLGGIAARIARVPAVVSAISGLGFVFLARGIRGWLLRGLIGNLYRLSFGHSNICVIFQNPVDQSLLAKLTGLSVERTCLIRGSGVDLREYKFRSLPKGPPVVMLAARLLADKGIREFVDAATLLSQSTSSASKDVRFVLVGDLDPDNPASLTAEELEEWRRSAVVELWGHRADMAATLATAHIVVLPSYREGLPKVLVEAAACGRAVVTTDVPGCRDAIEPGQTGILVAARSAKALAEGIGRLLDSPQKQIYMGKKGRELAEREFDIGSVVSKHIQIYSRLLEAAR